MSGFTTKIDLLTDSIYVKELKVKHFKTILKTLLGANPDIQDVLTNFVNILTETTPYSLEEIYSLSIIDFLLLIIQIRAISIGGSIQLEITDKKNFTFEFDLEKTTEIIKNTVYKKFTETIDNIQITYQYPTFKNFLLNNEINNILKLKNYIKLLQISNYETIEISKLDNDTFLQLFKSFPANISAKIFKQISKIAQQLNQINLLQYLTDTDSNITLYFNKENFIFILQILFSTNLLPLYENIFALAKFANIQPQYIEECTPGEYTIFIKMLERILKEQNISQKPANSLPPINEDNPDFM